MNGAFAPSLHLVALFLLGLALLAFAAGCDQGEQRDDIVAGPPVRIVAANVGSDAPLPADGVIEIAFDRPLLPITVVRQSVVLRDGSGAPVEPPVITYDPVAKVVALRGARSGVWLTEGIPYKITLVVARGEDDSAGLRAIDRAPLARNQPREIAFFAGPPRGGATAAPMRFCDDVLPIFQRRCSLGTCHGSGSSRIVAASGLVLDTPLGVLRTAVGRVALGANTGPLAGVPRPPGRVFGVDMALIAPNDPGGSYLLYKLLLADTDASASPVAARPRCDGQPSAPPSPAPRPETASARWTADDRATLGAYVTGAPMPFPTFAPSGEPDGHQALSFEELERIRAWIAQGASVDTCGACAP